MSVDMKDSKRQRKRQTEPRIESAEEVEVDSNEPEYELPEDTNESNSQCGFPHVTEQGELHRVDHLLEENERDMS